MSYLSDTGYWDCPSCAWLLSGKTSGYQVTVRRYRPPLYFFIISLSFVLCNHEKSEFALKLEDLSTMISGRFYSRVFSSKRFRAFVIINCRYVFMIHVRIAQLTMLSKLELKEKNANSDIKMTSFDYKTIFDVKLNKALIAFSISCLCSHEFTYRITCSVASEFWHFEVECDLLNHSND